MTVINETQLRAAIRLNEEKLARQEQACEATRGMLELLRQQLQAPPVDKTPNKR